MTRSYKLKADVAVIGGGIVGCATAYYLARMGRKAVLLDKGVIGGEASGRNGGGVRSQCRDRRERRLAMASIELWQNLEQELGFSLEYVRGGNIRLATNEARMEALRREGEEELNDGLYVELWDQDELRRRAPYLGEVFTGAKYCPSDGHANPLLAPKAFGWAARRLGATLMPQTEALAVTMSGGRAGGVTARGRDGEIEIEAPWIVHAVGPWAPQLAGSLGLNLPVQPARAVVAVTGRQAPLFGEFISSHDLGVYARQAREGHVHIGGIGTPGSTFDQATPANWLARLSLGLWKAIPALRGASYLRTWAGTLAMTPDKVPIIGPAEGIAGYLLATGFSGHGFCLGPIVGKLLAEWIVEGEPSLPLDDFRLARFMGATGSD